MLPLPGLPGGETLKIMKRFGFGRPGMRRNVGNHEKNIAARPCIPAGIHFLPKKPLFTAKLLTANWETCASRALYLISQPRAIHPHIYSGTVPCLVQKYCALGIPTARVSRGRPRVQVHACARAAAHAFRRAGRRWALRTPTRQCERGYTDL